MKLFLVQHGVAKSEAEDPQRGLNEEGRRSVERMAELLKSLHLDLQRIEHSEKRLAFSLLKERRRSRDWPRWTTSS